MQRERERETPRPHTHTHTVIRLWRKLILGQHLMDRSHIYLMAINKKNVWPVAMEIVC